MAETTSSAVIYATAPKKVGFGGHKRGNHMSLGTALAPFNGDYNSLFTAGNVLLKSEEGWKRICVCPPKKRQEAFFTKLMSDLAEENPKAILNPDGFVRRINEVWTASRQFSKPSLQDEDPIRFCFKNTQFAFLSNFYPTAIVYNDTFYSSAEAAFQQAVASRLNLSETRQASHETWQSPLDAKHFEHRIERRWAEKATPSEQHCLEEFKIRAMKEVVATKFRLNPNLERELKKTNPCSLIEDTEDYFWGRGTESHPGSNNFGQILMNLRASLVAYGG